MSDSPEISYLLPIPAGHRTDWGAAFVEALEERLEVLRPQRLDRERSGTALERGGQLVVRLFHADTDERVEIYLWEDEADVRYNSTHMRFRLPRSPAPTGWIPDAQSLVEQLLAGRVAVRTEYFAGRAARRHTVALGVHASDGPETHRTAADQEGGWWSGSSFL